MKWTAESIVYARNTRARCGMWSCDHKVKGTEQTIDQYRIGHKTWVLVLKEFFTAFATTISCYDAL